MRGEGGFPPLEGDNHTPLLGGRRGTHLYIYVGGGGRRWNGMMTLPTPYRGGGGGGPREGQHHTHIFLWGGGHIPVCGVRVWGQRWEGITLPTLYSGVGRASPTLIFLAGSTYRYMGGGGGDDNTTPPLEGDNSHPWFRGVHTPVHGCVWSGRGS